MARNTDAQCRVCRRAGEKLFLKGERCLGPKCAFTRRSFAPGMHGAARRRRPTEYGIQLREKQKAKAIYGLLERQFRRYIDLASKTENTGFSLLKMLESRLDNIVYRAGWADSRAQARQLVTHGMIKVGGKKLNIPSYICKEGELISGNKKEESKPGITIPDWLKVTAKEIEFGKIASRQDIETNLNEQLIIEYYSR